LNTNKLRWGILGAAEIARKIWKAIQLSGNGTVTAVASRDQERAREFISVCQREAPMENAPCAFGSYEELLASPTLDAVYIPLPTAIRKPWVIAAAEAGKHVVCEKPCAVTVADMEEMLAACRRNRVQFMDGVMFVHSERFRRLREILDKGERVGKLRRISSAFSFLGTEEFFSGNIRVQRDLEPLGCLGDLGWYCLRLALWVMNWQMPVAVTGRLLAEDSTSKVPTAFSGELVFKGGVSASFYCSFITEIEQWAIISGTNGYTLLEDFVLPFAGTELGLKFRQSDYQIQGCDFRMETNEKIMKIREASHGTAIAQEMNCYRAFADSVLSGELNPAWPESALKTQIVMCACLESARMSAEKVLSNP
jgi:predicted dehydrogenase